MRAWTKTGNPTDHIDPWGVSGAFTTVRLFPDHHIPFLEDYILRLLNSAEILQQPWIPEIELINQRIEEYIAESGITDGLIRICIFDESLAISDRPAKSNGTPVKGWLLEYRRPVPAAKSTEEKDLYGRLSELNVPNEDWIIVDPKDNDIRESATSNLIFAKGDSLVIPEKRILQGIVLQHILPRIQDDFEIMRATPLDQEISQFEEIILCGTGRGIAQLTDLPELGWSSKSDNAFSRIRKIYDNLIEQKHA
jgi:branched-subunit amino acid aminotransferase/4-amino-4-deoxychorismate lyase